MSDLCQSCEQAPVEIVKSLDDPAEPYRVCSSCFHRLMSHSLRPREWYNLSSIHGRLNDLLSTQYYDERDGKALKPTEEVVDAALFPCPTFEEAADSPDPLLTYILTRNHSHEEGQIARWYIHQDLISAMQRYSPDALLSVFAERLSTIKNLEIIRTIFHLMGLTLGTEGAAFIRENWERFASTQAFRGIAFAASRCLPLEEAHEKVTHILSGMDIRSRAAAKQVLEWFETPLNLDWIEKNVSSPVDSSWGLLAASSKFDWERAKQWLSVGRPLSLVALDALYWCICTKKKPPLPNPPGSQEFTSILEAYLSKDNVRRVREQVYDLLEFYEDPKRIFKRPKVFYSLYDQIEKFLAAWKGELEKGITTPKLQELLLQNGLNPAHLPETLDRILQTALNVCPTCGILMPRDFRTCSCGASLPAPRSILEDRLGIRATFMRALTAEDVDALMRSTPLRFIVHDLPKRELTLIPAEKNHDYWEKTIKPRFLEPADPNLFFGAGAYQASEWRTESQELIIVLDYGYRPV